MPMYEHFCEEAAGQESRIPHAQRQSASTMPSICQQDPNNVMGVLPYGVLYTHRFFQLPEQLPGDTNTNSQSDLTHFQTHGPWVLVPYQSTGKGTAITTIDVPPLVEISADQFLQDEQWMKKLMARFCDAIYAHTDQDTIDGIIEESLRLCGGSREILSTVLQAKFFLGHTPFYWAIVNKDPKHVGIPLLLGKLFSVCGSTVDATTEEEIVLALLLLEDPGDDLYQSIEPHLGTLRHLSTPSYFQGEGQQPTVKGTSQGGLQMQGSTEFCIPNFFDRLMLEKEVCFTFIAMGSLWHLRAAVDGLPYLSLREWAWHLELTETKS
ncbi:hypothetical protein FA13DRAFT_1775962 [Coprinellus micaceus]|uniref:Uncharacterized protein n=1 Tax=Coprinellus micaceus TaxID=71717 RepID=A0A4Y7T2Z1_COPMI|nr:hypothetical protein FA13DRAFT_1775962 [Coprinellus micaceus]